jgi:HK97 family phage major capsid protein
MPEQSTHPLIKRRVHLPPPQKPHTYLIRSTKVSFLNTLIERREAVKVEIEAILAAPVAEKRTDLTDAESAKFNELTEESRALDTKIESATAQAASDAKLAEARASVAKFVMATGSGAAKITEPLTYSKEGRNSFARDMVRSRLSNDVDATVRLQRHMKEVAVENRANSTTDTAGGEFVPPLWVLDDYAEYARGSRVGSNLVTVRPMPEGTDSINIPTITTGTKTAFQGGNNAAVTHRDLVTSSVAGSVETIAGYNDVSIQLIQQSPLAGGIDELVFGDLMEDYVLTLNTAVVGTDDGTSNTLKGMVYQGHANNLVTWTETTPTALGMITAINKGISAVGNNRKKPAEAILMTLSQWSWLNSQVDSQGRPLILPGVQGPTNAVGISKDGAPVSGLVGVIGGLPVYADLTMTKTYATNQAPILVGRFSDSRLYESELYTGVFPDVNSSTLGVRFRLHGYVALAHRHAKSIVSIDGTGAVAPTGY